MPKKLSRPIIVAVGGDAYQGKNVEMFRRMNRMVAYNDPDFIVMGGDLAYTIGSKHFFKGRKWEITRWQMFFLELQKTMMGKDGRLIPLLPVVGNHDVRKTRPQKSEMFYELFPFPVPMTAYRAVDFGDYLSWVLLDTGHTSPIEGVQTEWLERTLEERKDSPYLFTAYHIAAYPSYYPYDGKVPEKLRSNWVPLFEQYQVPAAFEHHNHTYKQTHPLKGGKVDPAGITYFGDGVWSVSPRQPQPPSKLWYLLKSESINMCYILTLTSEKCTIEAKNYQGNVIDQFISPVRQPAAASR
jgi:3',5'-cyclic AMP phosphodiesterase CpdA